MIAVLLLAGCTPLAPPLEPWVTVPKNCAVEYDHRAQIVASYCAVPHCRVVCDRKGKR